MSFFQYVQTTPPDATAYDASYPSRSTELFSAESHQILASMSANTFNVEDGLPNTAELATVIGNVNQMIQDVFDYAALGITNFRDHESPDLPLPSTVVTSPIEVNYKEIQKFLIGHYRACVKVAYFIYYLWETENDPLRIGDYMREALLNWPIQESAISLNDETGLALKVFPAWNQIET